MAEPPFASALNPLEVPHPLCRFFLVHLLQVLQVGQMVFVGSAKDSHWGSDLNFDFITVERSPFFVFSHSGITFPSCLVLLSF